MCTFLNKAQLHENGTATNIFNRLTLTERKDRNIRKHSTSANLEIVLFALE